MPEAIVVSIPARDVPTLRSLALADFSVSAEQIAEARHEDDAALSREMADECAQMLGLLGWDTPVETDSLIPARREFLWGLLEGGLASCIADLSTSDDAECLRLACRIEGAS